MKEELEVIVRGLILLDENMVVCKMRGSNWFFLPGGHVDPGECVTEALGRELQEELGLSMVAVQEPVGVVEHFYTEGRERHHEVNFVFLVLLPEGSNLRSKEKHIEFVKISKKELSGLNLLPQALKDGLVRWLEDSKPFLVFLEKFHGEETSIAD